MYYNDVGERSNISRRQRDYEENMKAQTEAMKQQAEAAKRLANEARLQSFRQYSDSRRYSTNSSYGGNIIDSAARKIAPWILIPMLIALFVMRYWMYIVSVVVIAIACVLTCKSFQRKGKNPALIIIISIGLIIGVFYIVPVIENGGINPQAVSRIQTLSSQSGYMFVNSDALNVRSGPSTNYDVVGQLIKSTRVQILDSSGQWWKIKSGKLEGYVNSAYLANEEKPSPVSTTPAVRKGMSTTLDPEFQRAYEKASYEMDAQMSGVPLNLRLPGGDTVADRIGIQTGDE